MRNTTKNLTVKIVVALIGGIVSGVILKAFAQNYIVDQYILKGVLHVVGQIFIASLKMLVVPLVFVSLVCGVNGLDDIKNLGRLGSKTFFLYLITTALAITIALYMAWLFNPGGGFNLPTSLNFNPKPPPPLTEVIIDMFPTNPIQAAANGQMLQIIVFAILFGLGISLSGEAGAKIATIFENLNQVILKIITMLMILAPYGVFALIAKVFAEQGIDAIKPLAVYFFTVLFTLLVHGFGVMSLLLKVFSGLNPMKFFSKMRQTIMFAFSTASSNATIPITMSTVTKNLGVSKSIASFSIPLGATINMDGTAIMQGVATMFISQAYNIPIGVSGFISVVVTATLASIGTAGVPGVGLITLAMVLRQVGLPVEGIGIIVGVDRLLDMVRTAVNVTGDSAVSCIVAKSENQIDMEIYNKDDPKQEMAA